MKLLTSKPPQWRHETWAERINAASTLLSLRGLLTDKERERVHARLMKKLKQEQEQTK